MGHPAHVHFFKNAIWALEKQGHAVCVTARDKDVTLKLLEAYKIPYENRGSAGPGTINKGLNMVKTDFKMLKIARKFKPDVVAKSSAAFLRNLYQCECLFMNHG
jgi:hypothetical protein